MKKKLLSGLVAGLLFVSMVGGVSATTLTSKTNTDNGYVIYLSTDDTIAGTSFGSGANWPSTFTDTTTLSAGNDYYLHIYAYDLGGPAGLLGEFSLSGGDHEFANNTTLLLTNTTDWSGNNVGWGQPYLTSLTALGANGVSPWGTRPAVNSAAQWIWAGDNNAQNYAYFSTKITSVAPVPEPATILLFGTGIAGLAGVSIRRKNKSLKS